MSSFRGYSSMKRARFSQKKPFSEKSVKYSHFCVFAERIEALIDYFFFTFFRRLYSHCVLWKIKSFFTPALLKKC